MILKTNLGIGLITEILYSIVNEYKLGFGKRDELGIGDFWKQLEFVLTNKGRLKKVYLYRIFIAISSIARVLSAFMAPVNTILMPNNIGRNYEGTGT